jgi:hypothetical protein
MSIGANGKTIAQATKELSLRWAETAEAWKDARSLEFERQHLVELTESVNRAVPVFDDLEKLISRVRSDCE